MGEQTRRYEETKRELATRDWVDMNDYAQAKTEVIESIIAAALSEIPQGIDNSFQQFHKLRVS